MKKRLMMAVTFFLIAMGLGYPTLSRYAPRETIGLVDAKSYAAMAEGRPAHAYWHQYRVLIPALARPFRGVVEGRIGGWDPTALSLLIVNSMFVAWAAVLMLSIAERVSGDPLVAFCASLLYLLSFNVSNLMLAGLVDSVEAWAMLAATWALASGQWKVLPVVGAVAAAGKETSVVFLMVFCVTWYVALARGKHDTHGLATSIAIMIVAQVATVCAVQYALVGGVFPLSHLVEGPTTARRLATPPWAHFLNREMLFAFGWMLPLALFRVGRLPLPWIAASATTLLAVSAVAIRFAVEGTISRPAFNVIAPILVLSVTLLLADSLRPAVAGKSGGPAR